MKLTKLGDLDVRIAGGTDREGAGTGPVVILLHGYGAPGDDLAPLWRTLAAPRGTRFVFPAAPIDLGPRYMGGRAWWHIDIEERMRRVAMGEAPDPDQIPDGLVAARTRVLALVDEVVRTLQPAAGKMVLGGFSQGGMLALDVALHSAVALAGLVVLSGTHIAAREWAARFEARRGLPVFMSHGRADEILPFRVAEGLRGTLTAQGLPVEWVPFQGGHGIPPAVADAVGAFLSRVLA
jgi:phospholipase/carboxylesterase